MKYFNQEGKEVKVGDFITSVEMFHSPYGEVESTIKFQITNRNLADLIAEGIITEEKEIEFTPENFIHYAASTIEFNEHGIKIVIKEALKLFPNDVFAGILKKVAIKLDKKYPDHITNSEEFWLVDKLTHQVFKDDSTEVWSAEFFKYKAVFRSKEDAELGVKITESIIKYCNE